MRRWLAHKGQEIHLFEADLIAWDLIVLEFKVLAQPGFAPEHYSQIIQYLKFWKKDLGVFHLS